MSTTRDAGFAKSHAAASVKADMFWVCNPTVGAQNVDSLSERTPFFLLEVNTSADMETLTFSGSDGALGNTNLTLPPAAGPAATAATGALP